jgi:DNA (cytosine-5)-methyltransferase 1
MAKALERQDFKVVWANDIEPIKHDLYVANHFDPNVFHLGDIRDVNGLDLPKADLATASFPCVDLSLAGNREGLTGEQSGMFWEFARTMGEIPSDERPRVALLENVHGFATSQEGKDLSSALEQMNELGYSTDVFAINASHFVPQSRPRMFVVGVSGDLPKDAHVGTPPISDVRPEWIRDVFEANGHLSLHYKELPELPSGSGDLSTVVQKLKPADARWWDAERMQAFVESLSPLQTKRLETLRSNSKTAWRTAYRRTRQGVARWEIRADDIAGCLRTTGGGSSKQAIVVAGRGSARVRWMTPLEYARLMGAGDFKTKSGTENQALFGFGDAVVVDVIAWIAENYLIPTLRPSGE